MVIKNILVCPEIILLVTYIYLKENKMYELNGVTKGGSLSLNVFTWSAMRSSCGKILATTRVKTTLKFKENT